MNRLERWSDEQTCKFVEMYRDNECLWNINLAQYKNKQARDSALQLLVKGMDIEGFGAEEAKNKIRSLRATYMGELTKKEKSIRNGGTVHKPHMKWFYILQKVMLDLKKIKRKRRNSATLKCYQNSASSEGDINEPEPSVSSPDEGALHIALPKHRRSRINVLENTVKELKKTVDNLCNEKKDMGDAECDVFGQYVSVQLKQLPVDERIAVQTEVQSILSNSRLKHFKCDHAAVETQKQECVSEEERM